MHHGQPKSITTKFIFVTGGVMSGIGKGVTTASIGKLMQFRGFKVSILKIDPYLNVDPGTLNPIEHGECFVTDQVFEFNPINDTTCDPYATTKIAELDQDFGTYERFLDVFIHPSHNITSGQIYFDTILKERKGLFLGKTVQIIPHCTDMIKERIKKIASEEKLDVLLIECGGTVGDVESMIFLEAFRQMRLELKEDDTLFVHVVPIFFSKAVGELKSKPAQHSVKALQSAGLQPDIVICRSEIELNENIKRKVSLFCNVRSEFVISSPDLPSIYSLPLTFESQSLGDLIGEMMNLKTRLVETNYYSDWQKMCTLFTTKYEHTIKIGMPGKYLENKDSYISINEALRHACAHEHVNLEIEFIDTENLNESQIKAMDGILLTPGFGSRGVEGMIRSAEIAIEDHLPYLGICYGSQLMYIAFMRKLMGLKGANTTEIDPNTPYPVVSMMDSQMKLVNMGGTMRLGGQKVFIEKGTKMYAAYRSTEIRERFRHRFHINTSFLTEEAKKRGLCISAKDESGKIVNAIEICGDHWMVGTQFHPEFQSRPNNPSPIYHAFIKAIIQRKYSEIGEKK